MLPCFYPDTVGRIYKAAKYKWVAVENIKGDDGPQKMPVLELAQREMNAQNHYSIKREYVRTLPKDTVSIKIYQKQDKERLSDHREELLVQLRETYPLIYKCRL